jgi:hypothetical protein
MKCLSKGVTGRLCGKKTGFGKGQCNTSNPSEAIERAREMNPDAAVHVERVRDTNVGGRDKWRKP